MQRIIDSWNWFTTMLYDANLKQLREQIKDLGAYDLHDILRQEKKVEWCEWHLNINENDKAIKIAEEFHQNVKKLKLSSSIVNQVKTIEETFLKLMPQNGNDWEKIRVLFKKARDEDNPFAIIEAYTVSQAFSCRLNKHSAANTYHALKYYCTLLNCPILAQTQEYTEAFTNILFHPKLEGYLVRNQRVYRGIFLDDKKLVDGYKEGATIITTTFLSTSVESNVADLFCGGNSPNGISIVCVYDIKDTNRRTALNLKNLSYYSKEEEILILRYIPFTIKSVERTDDDRKMTIYFEECEE